MTHVEQPQPSAGKTRKFRLGPFMALGGVVASLALMASIYLGHDIIKSRVTPCEGIFQQTTIGLSTKIKLLKAEGALEIGREALAELSERAQMVALNLKTCCTVLDAGRLNPEEFLQCKSKARQYDAKVADVVTLAAPGTPIETGSTSTTAAVKDSAIQAASPKPAASPQAIEQAVDAARNVSKAFNAQVVEVRKEQALEALEALPDAQVEIASGEKEPNNDAFSANVLPLDTWAKAAINPVKESDYFTFTTPEKYRDWIRIEVQNRSTTLHPRIELFNADKSAIASPHNKTAGGDVRYDFVSAPGARYTVRLSSYYENSAGVYLIRVAPQKSYDAHEPNDTVLDAKGVAANSTVEAKIMDGRDIDYFSVDGDGERDVTVKIANRSATLHPRLVVYNADKTEIGTTQNKTAGGDVTYKVKAPAGPVYVRVSDYYDNADGEYQLTVAQ